MLKGTSVDATKSAEQKRLLEIELEAVGIRLNSSRPDVVVKQKAAGGVTVGHHSINHPQDRASVLTGPR